MKYIYVLFLFVSFANLAEDNLSYRAKFTALAVDSEIKYQGLSDLYLGDFLVSSTNTQSQKITLNESLSILELGTSYNWGYLVLSADYAFNILGDRRQENGDNLFEDPTNQLVFGDDGFTSSHLIIEDIEYQSGQVSIGFGNGDINVFGGYKIDTQITTMNVESNISFYQEVDSATSSSLVLDNVVKGPFAGVSLLYDVTENSYIAVKLALTQYESGHLMLSKDNVSFNRPLTGKALSFSTRWTSKYFFVGFQSKYYKSDSNDELSVQRSEIGLDIGIHFL